MASGIKTLTDTDHKIRPWKAIAIALVVTVAVGFCFYHLADAYVIFRAEKNIENLLLSHKSLHLYVKRESRPAVDLLKDQGEIKPDFFSPELMSSSYMVRNLNRYYNQERSKNGLPEIYYKMAAVNPRNPINKADPLEQKLIKMFNADKSLKKYRDIVEIDGQKYLYYALPFLKTNQACLKCHGDRQAAPRQLQIRYPGNGGFGDKIGNIRAIESIRAPLGNEFNIARMIFLALLAGVAFLFVLLLFNRRLSTMVHHRTQSLESEIARRIQAKEALRESEQDYSLLIKSLPGVVYRGYPDWSVEFPDNKIRKFTGYDFKQFNSRKIKWIDVIFEQDINSISRSFLQASQTEKSFIREYRIKTKDGGLRWIQDRGQIVKVDEEIDHVSGVFFDITEHKQAEEQRILLATAIEQAAESVIISAKPGTIQYVNPAFERLSGYAGEEIVGKHFSIFESGKHDESFYKEMWETISRGNIWSGYITNKMKDGSLCEFETIISPVRDNHGKITNFVSVSRDVTQERAVESQLQQAHKMQAIGTLAGGIAHDFNNILSAVIGYTELAACEADPNSLQYNNLQEVLKAGSRAKDLVNQILTFSRQSEQDLKPIQVNLIVKEALKLIRASLPTTVEIQKDLQSDAAILGDQIKIHQILINLCMNAGHAMRENGGVLNVSLADVELDSGFSAKYFDVKAGSYLKLSVTDSGHGMPPGLLEHIFDPFFTTKEKGEGTGMGLSVVHGIVKSHGGTISVYSEPDKGSTFNVYLPSVEKRHDYQLIEEKPVPAGTEHILFVDDEPTLADMGKQLLESLGYKVTTRTSSIEALELFKTQPESFDLVITDLTMPNMTGDNLAKQLLALRPDIPIILCTGFSTKITAEKAQKMGIRAFILKPIIKREIAETIRKVLP